MTFRAEENEMEFEHQGAYLRIDSNPGRDDRGVYLRNNVDVDASEDGTEFER